MLDSSVLQAPLLDHDRMDLDSARRITYVLEQSFRYDYDAPVRSLRQRLVVVPPARHGSQYRRAHLLEVKGAAARRRLRRDVHGNVVARLHAEHVPHTVEFRLAAVVERVRDDGPAVLPASALGAVHLMRPTRLTAADDRLRALAAELAAPGHSPLETAESICGTVHAMITYEFGVTSVRTTAAEALAGGRGVCQDFAHVMLGLCRSLKMPTRYVSGYLAIETARATHAWVEIWIPTVGWVAMDPTHNQQSDATYIKIGTGRDYADVPPVSGYYKGTLERKLEVDVQIEPISMQG